MFNHTTRSRSRRLVAVAAIAGLLLAACGSDDNSSSDDAATDDSAMTEETTAATDGEASSTTDAMSEDSEPAATEELSGNLRWAVRENLAGPAQTAADAFMELNPDVTIELELLPAPVPEYIQRLVTARLGDDLPDILMTGDQYVSVLSDAEITADLTPYLDSSDTMNADYFSENFLDAFIPKFGPQTGQIVSLPQSADAIVIFYNKDMFDEAGLDYPSDDWTQEDLLAAATALNTDDHWGFYERPDFTPRYNALTQSLGGEIVNAEVTEMSLNSPEAMEAWHLMIDPMLDGGPYVPQEEVATLRYDDAFSQGRVAMFPGVRANVPAIRDAATFEWDVASVPRAGGERRSGAGSIGIGITQAANDPDLAWAFLEWYFSPDGGVPVLTATYAVVPAIPSLFDDPSWTELPPPPANTEAFAEAIDTGTPNPRLPFTVYSGLNDAVVTAIQTVTLAGGDFDEAFATANQQAQAALDEALAGQ